MRREKITQIILPQKESIAQGNVRGQAKRKIGIGEMEHFA
jgi:hypothetical protein